MIYLEIKESKYKIKIEKLTFYFSSQFYLEKFTEEYNDFIKNETARMNIRYKTKIKAEEMLLLLLYKKIEKRGFRVYYEEKEIEKESKFVINFLE